MAYQNVGTPRFFINIPEWLDATGVESLPDIVFRTLPVEPRPGSLHFDPKVTHLSDKSFVAWLGHESDGRQLNIQRTYTSTININVVGTAGNEMIPSYNGFSIGSFNGTGLDTLEIYSAGDCGSVVIGTYYDMPHSPDLKLTMTREMDGVKRIRTKGGNDLVHHKYTKPPMWGRAAPWGIYGGEPIGQELARSGRRGGELSFSYLQDNDVFPELSSIEPYESTSAPDNAVPNDPYSDGDEWHIGATILDDDTFYNQVIHKTNGGQLPFIFQPDGSNNSPDGFAICKFDMNSFEFEQVAKNIYNINLKIREVW